MNQSLPPELQVQLGLRQGNGEKYHDKTWPPIGQIYQDRNIKIHLISLYHNIPNLYTHQLPNFNRRQTFNFKRLLYKIQYIQE